MIVHALEKFLRQRKPRAIAEHAVNAAFWRDRCLPAPCGIVVNPLGDRRRWKRGEAVEARANLAVENLQAVTARVIVRSVQPRIVAGGRPLSRFHAVLGTRSRGLHRVASPGGLAKGGNISVEGLAA